MTDVAPERLRSLMQLAIDQARLSPPQGRVGAVLAREGRALAAAHRGEDGTGTHAEVHALAKAARLGRDVRGATAFVTLEPCANLESTTKPDCAHLLADAGITAVYIGRYDRNPRINHQGWKVLHERGIRCYDFDDDLREQLDELNTVFPGHFLRRVGPTGKAKLDPTQNGGRYDLALSDDPDAPVWTIGWGTRDATSAFAIGGATGTVAPAPHRRSFDHVDKPSAYDFAGHAVPLGLGDIAIFRNQHGHALVRLLAVEPPPPYGTTPHVSLTFDYELRPHDVSLLHTGGDNAGEDVAP